jgi:ribosome-interacting GTPase 1
MSVSISKIVQLTINGKVYVDELIAELEQLRGYKGYLTVYKSTDQREQSSVTFHLNRAEELGMIDKAKLREEKGIK